MTKHTPELFPPDLDITLSKIRSYLTSDLWSSAKDSLKGYGEKYAAYALAKCKQTRTPAAAPVAKPSEISDDLEELDRFLEAMRDGAFSVTEGVMIKASEHLEELRAYLSTRKPDDCNKPMELLKLLGYVNAMVGYCQSLKPGTVISDEYMKRMSDRYIPNILKAAKLIAELLDSAQLMRESPDPALVALLRRAHEALPYSHTGIKEEIGDALEKYDAL
jgi:hypothetical protein